MTIDEVLFTPDTHVISLSFRKEDFRVRLLSLSIEWQAKRKQQNNQSFPERSSFVFSIMLLHNKSEIEFSITQSI